MCENECVQEPFMDLKRSLAQTICFRYSRLQIGSITRLIEVGFELANPKGSISSLLRWSCKSAFTKVDQNLKVLSLLCARDHQVSGSARPMRPACTCIHLHIPARKNNSTAYNYSKTRESPFKTYDAQTRSVPYRSPVSSGSSHLSHFQLVTH